MSPAINKTWYFHAPRMYCMQHNRMTWLCLGYFATEIVVWSHSTCEWQLATMVMVCGGDGAWSLHRTRQRSWLIEHTCRIFCARAPRTPYSFSIAQSTNTRARACQRIANVCEHSIECWIHRLSRIKCCENEWMNVAIFFNEESPRWNFGFRTREMQILRIYIYYAK